jgi:hypothetical protein
VTSNVKKSDVPRGVAQISQEKRPLFIIRLEALEIEHRDRRLASHGIHSL